MEADGWEQMVVEKLDDETNIYMGTGYLTKHPLRNWLCGVPGMNLYSKIDNLGYTLVNMAMDNEISIAMLVYGRVSIILWWY